MHSNCFLFAWLLYRRRLARGVEGYFCERRSRWGRFPHYVYGEMRNGRIRFVSFVPINPRHKVLPPPLFKGRVKWGDAPRVAHVPDHPAR